MGWISLRRTYVVLIWPYITGGHVRDTTEIVPGLYNDTKATFLISLNGLPRDGQPDSRDRFIFLSQHLADEVYTRNQFQLERRVGASLDLHGFHVIEKNSVTWLCRQLH